ncbi:MAG: hypothetical protein RLO80_03795 [Hyphomonas sp.]
MLPEDLARLHPRLFHLTHPESEAGIRRHGLLSTRVLLEKLEYPECARKEFLSQIRPGSVKLYHPDFGHAVVTDNAPLNEQKLSACLDDGLTPAEWMRLLNSRVFFWPDQKKLQTLKGARLNRDRSRKVLVFDTLTLLQRYLAQAEISPINTGATLYQPARRGRLTFTPAGAVDYKTWRRLRGMRTLDGIKEVTVLGGIPDASRFIIDSYTL